MGIDRSIERRAGTRHARCRGGGRIRARDLPPFNPISKGTRNVEGAARCSCDPFGFGHRTRAELSEPFAGLGVFLYAPKDAIGHDQIARGVHIDRSRPLKLAVADALGAELPLVGSGRGEMLDASVPTSTTQIVPDESTRFRQAK
jgi:hypothetical protein